LGVGKPPTAGEGAHHVLSGFPPEEREKVDSAVTRSAQGVEDYILKGPEATMNDLNREMPA
jgi:peptidyl-tRNA hydrolase